MKIFHIQGPLTFYILIKPADLNKFIKTDTTKHKKLLELYSAFLTSKKNLTNTDVEYNDKCIELAINKKVLDKEMYKIARYFVNIKENKEKEKEKTTEQYTKDIIKLKIEYMSFIFDLVELINEIYTLQTIYFTATKELLIEIKENGELKGDGN